MIDTKMECKFDIHTTNHVLYSYYEHGHYATFDLMHLRF